MHEARLKEARRAAKSKQGMRHNRDCRTKARAEQERDQCLSACSQSDGPSSPCSVCKPILGTEGRYPATAHTQRQKLSRMLHQNLEFQVQWKESGRSKQTAKI